jgi:cysteinyl-tRNA synthetase
MAQPQWLKPSGPTHQPGLKVYNSLTRSEVDFVPNEQGHITWYSCGPTVYDDAHLGHARNYVTIDIIRRILRDYFGFKIRFVMNTTDVDDKIILRGRQRHLYDEYKAAHRYIDDTVRRDAFAAWVIYVSKNLKRISTKTPPVPETFDAEVNKMYGDILAGSSLQPGVKPGDAEAKIKMHINTSRAAARALTEDPRYLTPHEFYARVNDPMCNMLDERGKETIKGDDHAVFTKLTREYEDRFFKDMHDLNVLDPDELVRVTEYGKEIADFVKRIVDNKFAYKADDGSVYFDIKAFEAAGYPYARLKPESRGDQELQADGEGALSQKTSGKKSDADFALWKASKVGEPSWASEWGPGRPGWHIECSAMASERLGKRMDIHSGGIDLAFPHHDNELAQSEAFWEGGAAHSQWVNYFLHMGHLSIAGSKMSKSLKNFTTIREALHVRKDWTARSLRIVFLLGEWRRGIEITDDVVLEGRSWEDRVDNFFLNILDGMQSPADPSPEMKVMSKELEAAQQTTQAGLQSSFATKDVMQAISLLIGQYNSAIKDKKPLSLGDHRGLGVFVTQMVNIFGLNGDATRDDALQKIGWSGLELSSEAEMYVRPLSGARDKLRQAAIAKSITPDKIQQIVSSLPVPEGAINGRPQRPSFARALSDFRNNVLTSTEGAADANEMNKSILRLCDQVRDVDLWALDVYLEDQENGPARVRPVSEGLRAARKEKEDRVRMKEEAKKQRELEAREKLMKGKISPRNMFNPTMGMYGDEFSEWDNDGFPTKLKDGSDLSAARTKKLKKEQQLQAKAHEKYLEAVKAGMIPPPH